jgi:hypothetical protein
VISSKSENLKCLTNLQVGGLISNYSNNNNNKTIILMGHAVMLYPGLFWHSEEASG